MGKTSVAIVGFGNVGECVFDAIEAAQDMRLAGIVTSRADEIKKRFPNQAVVQDIKQLENVEVAALCYPSRRIEELATKILGQGISTVDSFDNHGEAIYDLRANLGEIAKKNDAAAIIAMGWDPGTDSMLRAIFELSIPSGKTYTNFGPGMSMGHSVFVRNVEGVEDAVSITIPKGEGQHKRMVYVKLKKGASLELVEKKLKEDEYFAHDEFHLIETKDLSGVRDLGHGGHIIRWGISGKTHNQLMEYKCRVTNPSLTGQILASAARAAAKQKPGCYLPIEIPLIDFLPRTVEDSAKNLV